MVSGIDQILAAENQLVFITQVLLVTGPVFGFLYGAFCFYRKKAPLFCIIVVSAMGCMYCARLYEGFVWLATGGLFDTFNLSILGDVGAFLFLLSASYGAMDDLVDGREKAYRKYRLIPLAAPALILAAGIYLVSSGARWGTIASDLVTMVTAMFSSYFNLKHLIYPDVENGFIKSIRAYNLVTLLGTFSFVLLLIGQDTGSLPAFGIGAFLVSLWSFAAIPVLKGGVKKWTR